MVLTLVWFHAFCVFAQPGKGGTPPGLSFAAKKSASITQITPPHPDTLLKATGNSLRKQLLAGYTVTVDMTPANSGQWFEVPEGRVWQLKLQLANAKFLSLFFSEYQLPETVELFVYNDQMTLGAFDNQSKFKSGGFSVGPLQGDQLTIELFVPASVKQDPIIKLSHIVYGVRDLFPDKSVDNVQAAQPCEVNINCLQGKEWQTEKKAVCRLVNSGSKSATYCTGTLLNNSNVDGKYYIVTAAHCFEDIGTYNNTTFLFNYESTTCYGKSLVENQSVTGNLFRVKTAELDYALFELEKPIPFVYKHYYAGWSRETSGVTSTATIHHPAGDIKKISVDDNAPTAYSTFPYDPITIDDSHWQVSRWEFGATEGGSSGAGLFNQQKQLIGVLTGGYSSCSNPVNDFFAQFNKAWNYYTEPNKQLKKWLDPAGISPMSLNGYNPYSNQDYASYLTSNVAPAENVTTSLLTNGGYKSGHNQNGDIAIADSFRFTQEISLQGVYAHIFKANYGASNSKVTFKIWQSKNGQIVEKYSQSVLLSSLVPNQKNYIHLTTPQILMGDFYVGFQWTYDNPLDTFAIYHATFRSSTNWLNTSYVLKSNEWKPFNILYPGSRTSLELYLAWSSSTPVHVIDTVFEKNIKLYPNPARDLFYIDLSPAPSTPLDVRVFDLSGRPAVVKIQPVGNGKFEVKFDYYTSGLYIVQLINRDFTVWKKVMMIK